MEFLGNVSNEIDPDIIRLMLIELFSRVKSLEADNYTLKVLLFESELVDEELYNRSRQAVREYLKQQDEKKALDAESFAKMGIPFADWVNFVTSGRFNNMEGHGKI